MWSEKSGLVADQDGAKNQFTYVQLFSWDDFVNGKSEFYLWVSKRNFNPEVGTKWDDVFQKIDNEDTTGQVSISW